MNATEFEKLRHPIGPFKKPERFTKEIIEKQIRALEEFPSKIRKEVESLTDMQLNTTYRPEGWTIRQVVHHCADSHMNAYVRTKLTLTEVHPFVKPYWEDKWAELSDGKTMPVEPSLQILEGLHARWVNLLKTLSETDLTRKFIHPEYKKEYQINELISLYAWHCEHHLTHITDLKYRMRW